MAKSVQSFKGKPRILFVVNVDWFFLSHRLPIALAAKEAGAEVIVAAGDTGKGEEIKKHGLSFIPLPFSRKSTNPFGEACTLFALMQLYRKIKPDLIHHVSIKPVIYGSIAARVLRNVPVVNAIPGLGFVFSSPKASRVLRFIVRLAYRLALGYPNSKTIFQNADDMHQFIEESLVQVEKTILIRGSGVNCNLFRPTPIPSGSPVVLLASRMLWDKGIGDFVEAARLLHHSHPEVRFVLVGQIDEGNPTSIPLETLSGWINEGIVEWWGQREDMPHVLSQAHMVVLPSFYGEGLPKILLEAAASARPIIATDIPGCREIVRHGVNGILVPPRDVQALANAISELLSAPKLMRYMGAAGRVIAEEEFAEEIVIAQTLELYRKLLKMPEPAITKPVR